MEFAGINTFSYLCTRKKGEMLEWLKRHAWKACVPQKGIASSNLALSAKFIQLSAQRWAVFVYTAHYAKGIRAE